METRGSRQTVVELSVEDILNSDVVDDTTEYIEDENDENENPDINDDGDDIKCKGGDFGFITIVEKYGQALLMKSQTPAMRTKKTIALTEVSQQMALQFGLPMTEAQVKKKLNNMKTRAKSKSDAKKTGNKPIHLSNSEKKLLDLLHAEDNPSISSLNCKY